MCICVTMARHSRAPVVLPQTGSFMSLDSAAPRTSDASAASPQPPTAQKVFELLSVAQHAALQALSSGQTIQDAAGCAGVARNTITRWLRRDPIFRAAFNAWRQEIVESTRARILKMASDAASTVAKAIENGDARIALAVLKDLGLTHLVVPGSEEPALAGEQIDIECQNERQSVVSARNNLATVALERLERDMAEKWASRGK